MTILAALAGGFLFLIAMSLGAHGPSPTEFLIEVWQLPATVTLSGIAAWLTARHRHGVASAVLLSAIAAQIHFWWNI
ncbi:hypothetical protein [Sphingomonas yantingensis]|uniref:Uncharacterized protein n=1 Tax=Sphingomonas yantingensis TaxID=1241761 RepID=A0A7W9EKI3_9SPHN|nr:hypothetical protein [Sphingomonas yantingensis]MBB5700095.1 hypothetical protein [Sphingomonas yantingensis]